MANFHSQPAARNSAFTLVEILVVIGIVGLLSAILFPAFGRAREIARRATCNSNLHQIGLTMGLYVQDHNRLYPPVRSLPYTCRWMDCIVPYVKSTTIFNCPSFGGGIYEPVASCQSIDVNDQPAFLADSNRKKGGYHLNDFVDLWNSERRFVNVVSEVRLRRPESIVLTIDNNGDNNAYSNISSSYPLTNEQQLLTAGMKTRHQNGSNTLFVDGHVKWMKLPDLAQSRLWRALER